MLILACIALSLSIVWTLLVIGANAMTDAVGQGFQMGGSVTVAWLGTIALWLAWWFG